MKEMTREEFESQMDVVVNAEDLETVEDLEEVMERAELQRDARLAADPEQTKKRYFHKCTLLRGYAAGVIAADPWYTGYQLPPDYEKVLNIIAQQLEKDPPGDGTDAEVIHASLLDLRQWFHEHSMAIPEYVAWNEYEGPDIRCVSRYSPTPEHREFISLDAIIGNICVTLRNWARDDDRSDAKFEREYGSTLEVDDS